MSQAHAHFGQSGNTAIKVLHAYIFQLKLAYATYVNTIMLAAIMSLIALFKSKYCVLHDEVKFNRNIAKISL